MGKKTSLPWTDTPSHHAGEIHSHANGQDTLHTAGDCKWRHGDGTEQARAPPSWAKYPVIASPAGHRACPPARAPVTAAFHRARLPTQPINLGFMRTPKPTRSTPCQRDYGDERKWWQTHTALTLTHVKSGRGEGLHTCGDVELNPGPQQHDGDTVTQMATSFNGPDFSAQGIQGPLTTLHPLRLLEIQGLRSAALPPLANTQGSSVFARCATAPRTSEYRGTTNGL